MFMRRPACNPQYHRKAGRQASRKEGASQPTNKQTQQQTQPQHNAGRSVGPDHPTGHSPVWKVTFHLLATSHVVSSAWRLLLPSSPTHQLPSVPQDSARKTCPPGKRSGWPSPHGRSSHGLSFTIVLRLTHHDRQAGGPLRAVMNFNLPSPKHEHSTQ